MLAALVPVCARRLRVMIGFDRKDDQEAPLLFVHAVLYHKACWTLLGFYMTSANLRYEVYSKDQEQAAPAPVLQASPHRAISRHHLHLR
jgi:hypothetical protein